MWQEDGINSCFLPCKRIIVLAPHPDDEALGCAGTMMLLTKKGVSVRSVFISNGEKLTGEASESIAAKRKQEGIKAAELMNCEVPIFLGHPDSEIKRDPSQLLDRLMRIVNETMPDIILSPSSIDYHEDHIALSYIVFEMFKKRRINFKLVFYEVYTTIRFSHLVDISAVVEQKKKIIMNYQTSLYGKPEVYVHAILGLNAHKSLFVQKQGYYEAFYLVERERDYREIHDHLTYRDTSPLKCE